jgi:hypothetical protein
MEGEETLEGERTYRVHDLLHELAKELIGHSTDHQALQNEKSEVDALPGFGLTLPQAHKQLLERYKKQIDDCRWDKLPNDGYVHRHLTWHMEQVGWKDSVHELMAMSDDRGRNAWFEACEQIGQPAIFVQSIADGWRLAEELYDRDRRRAIVLQGRYALMTGTLNSLVDNLPAEVIAGFVHNGFWSVERAWTYVEQMQDERKIEYAITWLAVYLPKNLFQRAVQKAETIKDYHHRANSFSALLNVTDSCLDQAVELEQLMERLLAEQRQNINDPLYQMLQSSRQSLILSLARLKDEYFKTVLKDARKSSELIDSATLLIALAEINNYYLDEASKATDLVADKEVCAEFLVNLAKIDLRYFRKAFEAVYLVKNEFNLAQNLATLINIRNDLHADISVFAKQIQNIFCRARLLAHLANVEPTYLAEALRNLEVASDLVQLSDLDSVGNSYQYTLALISLTNIDASYFSKALKAATMLPGLSFHKEIALRELSHVRNSESETLLNLFRTLNGTNDYASVIVRLVEADNRFFSEAHEATCLVQDDYFRASLLMELAKESKSCLDAASNAKQLVQNSISRAWISASLARIEKSYFWEALEDAKLISKEDENIYSWDTNRNSRKLILMYLSHVEDANFPQILEIGQSIQDEDDLAWILVTISRIDANYRTQAIQAIRSIQNPVNKARVLGSLAAIDGSYSSRAISF